MRRTRTPPYGRGRSIGATRSSRAFVATSGAVAAVVFAVSSPASSTLRTTRPAPAVPLQSAVSSTTGDTAVIPMGQLQSPANTFWQVVTRSAGSTQWALSTPPGTATNGGVVVGTSAGPLPAGTLVAGIEPNESLTYSPLARTSDEGKTWQPGVLPSGLAPAPDVLAGASGAGYLAVGNARAGTVYAATSLFNWSRLANRGALGATPAGRACGVGTLRAVTFGSTGGVLVGTTCTRPGATDLFARAANGWRLAGPILDRAATVSVLRLSDAAGQVVALFALSNSSGVRLVAGASANGGPWTVSGALSLGKGSTLQSTGIGSSGGFVVLARTASGRSLLALEPAAASSWVTLTAPPSGTQAVVAATGGAVDALVVQAGRLTDERLASGTWSPVSTLSVPVDYGSSS